MRKNIQGTTAKVVVGLIVITFALFGIESILVSGGGNEIAEVNGEAIYPQQLQQSVDTQRRRLIAQLGDNLDPAMLDEDRLKGPALEALINRKLLMQAAQEMGLSVSEVEIGAVVSSMEQFQVDGEFSPEVYKSVLSSAGYTPTSFKQSLRDDLIINQLRGGIAGTEFITPAELELNAQVIAEFRDLRYLTIPLEKFSTELPVTDADIERYYQEHEGEYHTSERVDLDYIEISLDEFRAPVEESALLAAYEVAKDQAQFQNQNRVSHILFESADTAELQVQIDAAQQKLAAGEAFADVAGEVSDDVGSAGRGGDLGYSSGDAFPAEMEAVIAELEPGVVSEPVVTEAGTHLILVTERKAGEQPSFEEMRAELEESIQGNEARVALLRSVEALRDLSFNAQDLSYPAKELSLEIQHQAGVGREQNEGLFGNSSLIAAAFSEDVLSAGHNSEVIELPGNKFVVLRVKSHHMPELKPLSEVRDEVLLAVKDESARAAVAAEADRALLQLRKGEAIEQFATENDYQAIVELGVDRRNTTVPIEVLRRLFELPQPAPEETVTDFIMTPNGDAVVIELMRVSEGEYTALSAIEQQQLEQLLSAEGGSLIDIELQQSLHSNAKISVL